MNTRSRESLVTFRRPFAISAWDETLPAGSYRVVVDEVEVGMSFLGWRHVATMLHVPAVSSASSTRSVIPVDADELDRVIAADRA